MNINFHICHQKYRSAAYGALVFDEKLTIRWCQGAGIMMLGVVLIARGKPEEENVKHEGKTD